MQAVIRSIAQGIVVFVAAAAFAEVPVYGPRTFTVASGKPLVVTEPVTIEWDSACGAEPAYVLVVQNDRVSSAIVRWNGTPVVAERDLRAADQHLEIPLTAQNANTLDVELKGGPAGASLTLSIRRTIEEPIAPEAQHAVSGGRTVFRDSYAVADPGANFVLYVQNGSQRVSAATVSLNGETVIAQSDWEREASSVFRRGVTLRAQNELVIDARGPAGATLSVLLRRILPDDVCSADVAITSPDEGAVLTSASIGVRGTVTGSKDVGVTVNGTFAEIDLEHAGTTADPFVWFVRVPAVAGEVELIATATTVSGATVTDRRVVQFEPSPRAIDFSATPRSGVAPLEVTFHVGSGKPSDVVRYEIDFDGDGAYELSAPELPPVVAHTYDAPGEYRALVRTIMSDGGVETATISVLAHSWASMDGLLRSIWNRIAAALARQDVDAALRDFSPAARHKYGAALQTIRPSLPAYVQSVVAFDPVWIRGSAAHYLMRRMQDGRTVGYHVYFTRGSDGVWRLSQF